MCEIRSLFRTQPKERPATRNERTCPDCGRWTSRATDEGYCPACAGHARNRGAKVVSPEFAARLGGGDLDPLYGGPDDQGPPPPPAA
jgi:hypothetical protein